MDHCLRFTKQLLLKFIFMSLCILTSSAWAGPLGPDQTVIDPINKDKQVVDLNTDPALMVKWPKEKKYSVGLNLSNSRIDGFQIINNTKGTLVSEINMEINFQYFKLLNTKYDFSAGLNIEMIKMRDELNNYPISPAQNMAIGINGMFRYKIYENLYLKGIVGFQDKLFYTANASLTGYEIQKGFIPFISGGFSILWAEVFKVKIGTEAIINIFNSTSAGASSIESGQGYEMRIFSIWPTKKETIITDLFYTSRIQNTQLIRTQEQKIGLGLKYLYQ
jgi:hypothetical protein